MEGRDRQMLMAFFTGLAVGGSLVGILGFNTLASATAAVALVGMALLVWIFVEHGDTKLLAFGGSGVAKDVNEKEPDTPTDMAGLALEEQEVSYGEVDDNFFTPYDEVC
ncbi:hypothetical protein ACFX2I_046395 [Malus domestica]